MAVHGGNTSSKKVDNRKKLSPVNILSIDFDWIMEPSIEIYNDIVSSEDGPWAAFQERAPGVKMECSFSKYEDLCTFLGTHTNPRLTSKDILICNEHHELFHFIEKINRPFNLYNIDHHHDCGYAVDKEYQSIETAYQTLGLTCGNWVYALAKDHPDLFLSYNWICNYNSVPPINELFTLVPHFMSSRDLQTIDRIHFDKICLCQSSQWIPPEYRPLFRAMLGLFANFINK